MSHDCVTVFDLNVMWLVGWLVVCYIDIEGIWGEEKHNGNDKAIFDIKPIKFNFKFRLFPFKNRKNIYFR